MKAVILLEDGTILEGKSFGAEKTVLGEIVFNTGMTGYQEILTDPSYAGQIVVMTYPLVGNYGINDEDIESDRIQVSGFVVKEYAQAASNWKNTSSLEDYLKQHEIFAISDIDTRMLTKKIRNQGAMNCLMTTGEITEEKKQKLKEYCFPKDVVEKVSIKSNKHIQGSGKKIGIIDLGLKKGIADQLKQLDCELYFFPWNVSCREILSNNLDAVLFSNGPGDPKDVKQTIETAEKLIGNIPVFGICLGHQILALALGGDTYKMKFGHRGSNHPVQDLRSNKVMITAQNHGYAVKSEDLPKQMEITHINVNDETVEGFCSKELQIQAVQFHPEAGPGPRDANLIFKQWIDCLRKDEYNA